MGGGVRRLVVSEDMDGETVKAEKRKKITEKFMGQNMNMYTVKLG